MNKNLFKTLFLMSSMATVFTSFAMKVISENLIICEICYKGGTPANDGKIERGKFTSLKSWQNHCRNCPKHTHSHSSLKPEITITKKRQTKPVENPCKACALGGSHTITISDGKKHRKTRQHVQNAFETYFFTSFLLLNKWDAAQDSCPQGVNKDESFHK